MFFDKHDSCSTNASILSARKQKLTAPLPVRERSVWVVQLVEEALDQLGPVGSGVQTQLTGWTQSVLVHLSREDERVLHQRHHPQPVSLDGFSGPPAPSDVTVRLAVPAPHPGSETLAAPESSHQSQDPSFQLQPASGPLAHGHPGRLAQSTSLQAPHVEQLGGEDPRRAGVHLDQARGAGEGRVGQKPRGTEKDKQSPSFYATICANVRF